MQHRRQPRTVQRRARRTVRIVCEGDAEVCVVRHVRDLYTSGGDGRALSHRNARSKGGRRALELALSRQVKAGVDVMVILIDVDQDWDDSLRQRARAQGVQVLESVPCLEAWLLQVTGHVAPANSAACKRAFRTAFGGEAHEQEIYGRHFSRAALDGARSTVPVLDQLLRLIGV